MSTKEKIKKEIEQLPDELLERVYKYINEIKPAKKKKRLTKAYHLGGQFDNVNVREKAYE